MEASEPVLILIVDDNPTNLNLLFNFLQESGIRVLVTTSGQDALHKLKYISPDLILLDIMMPEMDGFEVCCRLKTDPQTQDIPVIFMTALTDVKDKVQGLALGAVDYITKPLQQEEVLSRVHLHLKLRSLTRNLEEKNQHLLAEIAARNAAETQLKRFNQDLEKRVQLRTQELLSTLKKLQDREEKLKYEASHDTLTGVFNRAWLMRYLSQTLNTDSLQDKPHYAAFFLDLDRFKNINDRLGHLAGDQLLKSIVSRMKLCLGSVGKIARLGGDEFIILVEVPRTHRKLESIAQALLDHIQRPVQFSNYQIYVTASIGIIPSTDRYTQPAALLRDADIAMYQAKRTGKGRYCILTPQLQSQALERLQLETDLRESLEREDFYLYYQPIFSLKTNDLSGFEALIRWRHPQKGILSPSKFIPLAEETGLIHTLDLWTLESACQQLAVWQKQFNGLNPLFINVNISAIQLRQPGIVEQIQWIFQRNNLVPNTLKLEVTESGILETNNATIHNLQRIHALGIQLCIDDFGTGYSSLDRLHSFPLSTLKIDRSFVSRLNSLKKGTIMVQTIIDLAHNLGLDVVAEGIETIEQLETLKELGCEFGQGYFFSKPLDREQASQLLLTFNRVEQLPD